MTDPPAMEEASSAPSQSPGHGASSTSQLGDVLVPDVRDLLRARVLMHCSCVMADDCCVDCERLGFRLGLWGRRDIVVSPSPIPLIYYTSISTTCLYYTSISTIALSLLYLLYPTIPTVPLSTISLSTIPTIFYYTYLGTISVDSADHAPHSSYTASVTSSIWDYQ